MPFKWFKFQAARSPCTVPQMSTGVLTLLAVYAIAGIYLNIRELEVLDSYAQWPVSPRTIYKLLLCVHIALLFAFIVSLWSLFTRNPLPLIWVEGILLACIAVLVVIGIKLLTTSDTKDLRKPLLKVMEKASHSDELKWFREYQYLHQCCGSYSFEDWGKINSSTLANGSAPNSCCKRTTVNVSRSCADGIYTGNRSQEDIANNIYIKGCGQVLSLDMQKRVSDAGIEMIFMSVVCAIVVVLIYCGLIRSMICLKIRGGFKDYNIKDEGKESKGEEIQGTSQTDRLLLVDIVEVLHQCEFNPAAAFPKTSVKSMK